jgi:hypothetical protein
MKMDAREDQKWHSLLGRSAPTFDGDASPPYGFVTGVLAQLRSENGQREQMERIGWRALLASLAALGVAAAVTLSVNSTDPGGDFDPGVRGLVQIENIQVS